MLEKVLLADWTTRELLCEGKAEERKVWMGRWTLSAEAIVHREMRQDGAETVTVKLEIGILKTVNQELLSNPIGDGKLCSDVTAH